MISRITFLLGYPFNRSKLRGWVTLVLARTIRSPWASSRPWFRTDADCLDYLEWLRWPAGCACSGYRSRYGLAAGRWSVHVFQVRQPDLGDSGHDL